ncbi:MAG: response regulator [Cyclobacteriaceae bacterium]
MKILTVEDNDINAMLMDRLLEELNFSIEHTIAESATQALAKTDTIIYDLVLMDINLGDGQMDGTEVLKILRTKDGYKPIPIFAVTCYALPGDKERFLEMGFNEYVSKPIDHDLLLSKIDKYQKAG